MGCLGPDGLLSSGPVRGLCAGRVKALSEDAPKMTGAFGSSIGLEGLFFFSKIF